MCPQKIEPGVERLLSEIRGNSKGLKNESIKDLCGEISDSDYILLGEATHGTSEFYRVRASMTKELIQRNEISFIAVEGDWPDCYRINRYVKNQSDKTAYEVLSDINRWPRWMWANWETLEFIKWLREYNEGKLEEEKVGFYGLDVYSLNDSIGEVVEYLEGVDPEAAEQARESYRCFDPPVEGADYAEKVRMAPENCRDEAVKILTDLRRQQFRYEEIEGEEFFDAEQNALVVKNAENYYRALTEADTSSWNIRDRHMAETLDRLMDSKGAAAKSIIWAHNSHVGDSSATSMKLRGKLNLGHLIRERHRERTSIIGFSTYQGEVVAADYWGGKPSERDVPPAREASYDELVHRALDGDGIVNLKESEGLKAQKGHRAIGVVYTPENEEGNYVPTELANRYDYLVHIDKSSSIHPITEKGEAVEPETYPWGV